MVDRLYDRAEGYRLATAAREATINISRFVGQGQGETPAVRQGGSDGACASYMAAGGFDVGCRRDDGGPTRRSGGASASLRLLHPLGVFGAMLALRQGRPDRRPDAQTQTTGWRRAAFPGYRIRGTLPLSDSGRHGRRREVASAEEEESLFFAEEGDCFGGVDLVDTVLFRVEQRCFSPAMPSSSVSPLVGLREIFPVSRRKAPSSPFSSSGLAASSS